MSTKHGHVDHTMRRRFVVEDLDYYRSTAETPEDMVEVPVGLLKAARDYLAGDDGGGITTHEHHPLVASLTALARQGRYPTVHFGVTEDGQPRVWVELVNPAEDCSAPCVDESNNYAWIQALRESLSEAHD